MHGNGNENHFCNIFGFYIFKNKISDMIQRVVFLLLSILFITQQHVQSQGYTKELDALNNFLTSFDDGFFGHMEVKDGYIFTRFKGGSFNKFKMQDMQDAVIEGEKVMFRCKNNVYCQSTDWKENSNKYSHFYGDKVTTSQLVELKDLLNNFKKAYLNTLSVGDEETNDYGTLSDDLDKFKSNIDILNVNTTSKNVNYEQALVELNNYLKVFDGTRYKGLEIKEGYIYSNYSNGNSSKAKMSDIDNAYLNEEYQYVKLACKNAQQCIFSTITGGYHDYFNFQTSTGKDLNKLLHLLNNFVDAYNNSSDILSKTTAADNRIDKVDAAKQRQELMQIKNKVKEEESDDFWDDFSGFLDFDSSSDNESQNVAANTTPDNTIEKYSLPLKKLNDYLPVFNSETYRPIEVKNGDVYFSFSYYSKIYTSKISISNLKNNTTLVDASYNTLKIVCSEDKSYFYSTYTNSYVDHFQFFTYNVKEIKTIHKLLEDFISAL